MTGAATHPHAMGGPRSLSWLVFASAFLAFSYFHAGGGWNQNARFAMARAVVEGHTFAIDDYLVYRAGDQGRPSDLARIPVHGGRLQVAGKPFAMAWRGDDGLPIRLDSERLDQRDLAPPSPVEPGDVSVSGDLSFHRGRFHPNKAPGGALLAIPAYALVSLTGRLLGSNPDDWWVLTLSAWLTSVFSMGLLAAWGSVLFLHLALAFTGGKVRASLGATFAFSFGTMYFAYATALYEHDVIIVGILASLWFLERSSRHPGVGDLVSDPLFRPRPMDSRVGLVLAGFFAGYTAITNYVLVVVVIMLGAYATAVVRRGHVWAWFSAGALGPFIVICSYNLASFGTVFTTNYSYMNPIFRASGQAAFGIFGWPDPGAMVALVASPFRGLLFTSPFLILGIPGLMHLFRGRERRAFAWLALCLVAFFVVFVSTMNEWHGGWAAGPRYLAPALPFLALPAAIGFVLFRRTSILLTSLSVAMNLLIVAVDIQPPVGVSPLADVPGSPQWSRNPICEYELPLLWNERAWPVLHAQEAGLLRAYESALIDSGSPSAQREAQVAGLRGAIREAIRIGQPAPLIAGSGPDGSFGAAMSEMSAIVGPVSANPMGMYEGWMFRVFPPGSSEARWNSFNAGEFLFPESRWSLLPLLLFQTLLGWLVIRVARRLDAPHAP